MGTSSLSRIDIVFRSAATAEQCVAGVPAAARATRAVQMFGDGRVACRVLVADREWTPGRSCLAECARLAPDLPLSFGTARGQALLPGTPRIGGEALVAAIAEAPADRDAVGIALDDPRRSAFAGRMDEAEAVRQLRRAGRALVARTGKPGDGIVSRWFNRPISQAISRVLLGLPGVTPLHASLGTAAIAIAMMLCLLLGGDAGLILGAILFQAASIVDGVDGEIARATFRTSDRGAMLDSLIDAATNLAFVTGLSINLALTGHLHAASAGIAGLTMLAFGLVLIGQRAKAIGQPVNFDVIKVHFRKRRSPVMEWLILMTMRDFFAAAFALSILVGWASGALFAFATVVAGWLVVTLSVLVRTGGLAARPASARRYAGPFSA